MTNETTAILFQVQSFLILSIIFIGVYFRRVRRTHVKLMLTAIMWDILLILQIELNRSAINTATKAMHNAMILNIHITLAVLTVFFYFAMLYTGKRFLKGDNSIRPLHKKLGWTTVLIRILTFVTSFFAVAGKA